MEANKYPNYPDGYFDFCLGNKILDWSDGSPIRVLEILDTDTWGLIRIRYRVKHGKKDYTLWCYPQDLKEVVK